MTKANKSDVTKKKNVIPPAVAGGIHNNIFYVLISIVFATLIVLVPTFLALAANVPTNVAVDRAAATSTAMTVSWTNSGMGASPGNRILMNGKVVSSSYSAGDGTFYYGAKSLAPSTNYVFKIGAYDIGGYTDWSFAAAAITKGSTNVTASPHASFADNSNMCSACHSIHKSRTRFKLLYSRYSELTSQYTGVEPGVDLCFNCHDGTGANSNVRNQYQGGDGGDAGWVGHKIQNTAGLSSTTTGGKGWKMPPTTQTTSVGQQLPCMVCHDAHISSKGNWRMLADGLYDYSISSSGGLYDGEWRTGTTLPWEQNTGDNKVTDTTTDTSQTELCTVCHHGSSTDNEMIVKGIDLYWNTSHDSSPTGGNKNCKSCHNGPHNLKKGAGYPTSQQDLCGCHESADDPYITQMDAESNTSLHYVNKSADNYPPTSNSCTFRCHNNHGERNPTRAFNVWVDQGARIASADYDFTASVSAPGLCLSCHSQMQTTVRPGGQTSNSSAYVSTIAVSSFISSAHSYRSESYQVGSYSADAPITGTGTKKFAFRASCLKCHRSSNQNPTSDYGGKYGPHASANRSLLVYPAASSVSALPGSNPGDEEQTCFWCHSPSKDQWGQAGGQRAMATVAWRISQAFAQSPSGQGHKQWLISAPIDRHRASEGTQPFWMTAGYRHVECFDCHNPHAASQGYNYWASLPYTGSANELESPKQGVISKALRGVWGVSPTTNWSSIPTAAAYTGGYNSATPIGRLFRTESAQKQVYICLKCHSSYAYGTVGASRPAVPSGVPGPGNYAGTIESPLQSGPQSDILADFNPNNIGYHPIFSPGRNQPPNSLNAANWGGIYAPNSLAYGTQTNNGITASFVPPWGGSSLVTCSDCHTSQSTSYSRGYYTSAASAIDSTKDFPRGPHGSSRRWLLTNLDRTISILYNNNTRFNYTSLSGTNLVPDRNICFNCHRADVYYANSAGAYAADAVASNLSRVDHNPARDTGDTQEFQDARNIWGIACMNCHGGGNLGTIHGTGGAPADTTNVATSPRLGFRLIYGAAWDAYTASVATGVVCSIQNAASQVSACTTHGNGSGTATGQTNYNY